MSLAHRSRRLISGVAAGGICKCMIISLILKPRKEIFLLYFFHSLTAGCTILSHYPLSYTRLTHTWAHAPKMTRVMKEKEYERVSTDTQLREAGHVAFLSLHFECNLLSQPISRRNRPLWTTVINFANGTRCQLWCTNSSPADRTTFALASFCKRIFLNFFCKKRKPLCTKLYPRICVYLATFTVPFVELVFS